MVNFWESAPKGKSTNSNFGLGAPTTFKKESIRSKKLSKWGDADLDGSPNIYDCDPRNVGAVLIFFFFFLIF